MKFERLPTVVQADEGQKQGQQYIYTEIKQKNGASRASFARNWLIMCIIRVQEKAKMVLLGASWKHHFAFLWYKMPFLKGICGRFMGQNDVVAETLRPFRGCREFSLSNSVIAGTLHRFRGTKCRCCRDFEPRFVGRNAVVAGTLRPFSYLSAIAKRPFAYSQKTFRL